MIFNGRKIAAKRAGIGISQKQLSLASGIAVGTISGIEKHNKLPNLRVLLKLQKILQVPITYFFEE